MLDQVDGKIRCRQAAFLGNGEAFSSPKAEHDIDCVAYRLGTAGSDRDHGAANYIPLPAAGLLMKRMTAMTKMMTAISSPPPSRG